MTYGPQALGVSQGSIPDGSTNVVAFPGSASPGTNNYLLTWTGPVLNEVLAANQNGDVTPWGTTAAWVELYNPGNLVADLAGMSLGKPAGKSWAFPTNTTISANGYMRIWCDGSYSPSTNTGSALNTGFGLEDSGSDLCLYNNAGQVVDSLSYGFQIPDVSIGRSGGLWQLLAAPTPGAANAAPAALGDPDGLRINEWLAAPLAGDGWFELYNTNPLPVDMTGLFLTDNPSNWGITNYQIAPLSYIGGRQWVKWEADGSVDQGRNHADFSLDPLGRTLRLYGSSLILIDEVDYGLQSGGVSQGRFPDGAATVYSMPMPTPGAANVLPNNPPALSAIGDRALYLGQTLQLTAAATDPDSWYQTLTFSLTNSPPGAVINSLTGTFTWAATDPAVLGTNAFTVVVTDNGVPPLSDAKTFLAIVQPPLRVGSVGPDRTGRITFTFDSLAGQFYQLQYEDDLSSPQWTPLGPPSPGTGGTLTFTDDMTAQPQRFYRIVVTLQ